MGGFQSTVHTNSAPVIRAPSESHQLQRHVMNHLPQQSSRLQHPPIRGQSGKIGYILLWLLGIPLPVLLVIYLLRGCS